PCSWCAKADPRPCRGSEKRTRACGVRGIRRPSCHGRQSRRGTTWRACSHHRHTPRRGGDTRLTLHKVCRAGSAGRGTPSLTLHRGGMLVVRLSAMGAAVVTRRRLGRRLPVAPHTEPREPRLEGLQASLDATHLLLDGRQRRHPLDRAPEALVDEPLQLAEAIRYLRQLLDTPPSALGSRAKHLHTTVDRGGEVLERRLAVTDDVTQNRQGEEAALSPLFL